LRIKKQETRLILHEHDDDDDDVDNDFITEKRDLVEQSIICESKHL
jgi:hypothetical protein